MAVTGTVSGPKSKTRANQLLFENSKGITCFFLWGFVRVANLAGPFFIPRGPRETNICSVSQEPEPTIEQEVRKSPAPMLFATSTKQIHEPLFSPLHPKFYELPADNVDEP